jgi:hypothetical protein
MVPLICQFQEDGLRHSQLKRLHQDLAGLDARSRPKCPDRRKPLRSAALLSLDLGKLKDDYVAGVAPYSLAIKYGINRETVAKRLKDAGIHLRIPYSR